MSENQGTAIPQSGTQPQEAGKAPENQIQGAGAANANGVSSDLTKEAAREAIRKLKIKHQDGAEEEVPEDEVLKVYRERKGHQKAANKELQEGRALRKQNEEFIQKMKDKSTLFDVIKKLGHDPRQLSEEFLASILEEEMLDPRERELKQTKTKLQQYEEMEKRQKEEIARKRDDEMKRKFADDYTKEFVSALQETKLPPTKQMVAEMAKYISKAAKLNFQMTAKEAAQLVKEDIEKTYQNLYGESDAETLVRLLGEQGVNKIRTYDTSRLRDPKANLTTPSEQPERTERTRSKSGERMSSAEWRKFKTGR